MIAVANVDIFILLAFPQIIPHLIATAVDKDLFREVSLCWGFLCGVPVARQQER